VSCFLPGPYSRMVPIDRRLTVDGAWLGRVPIRELAQLGTPRVVACVSDVAGRLLRGAFWTMSIAVPPEVDCRVLAPIAPLPVGAFDFDRTATLETFAIGRASAEVFADRNREWLGRDGVRPPERTRNQT
jgi:predicted acylesterase/phospholipase RssA